MKYSKKERREIYLKAAELIETVQVCCFAIRSCTSFKTYRLSEQEDFIQENFPEFMMFKPRIRYFCGRWWNFYDINQKEERMTVLLLCAEMCR